MITYEVTVTIEPALAAAFERYMRQAHIPEILATGCFGRIRFERADDATFRTAYMADERAGIERYLRDHTARFREDFARHFPEGVRAERRVWEEVEVWG
jgi:hypothetical protein